MVGVPHLTGRQKLFNALLVLACGPGNVNERLETTYRLAASTIDPQLDMPPEFKDEFVAIRNELQRVYFVATSAAERTDTRWASDMAKRLVSLYDKLMRLK